MEWTHLLRALLLLGRGQQRLRGLPQRQRGGHEAVHGGRGQQVVVRVHAAGVRRARRVDGGLAVQGVRGGDDAGERVGQQVQGGCVQRTHALLQRTRALRTDSVGAARAAAAAAAAAAAVVTVVGDAGHVARRLCARLRARK